MLLRNQVRDPFFPECPVRNVISRIGGKWPILILLTLEGSDKPLRFKNLRQTITDISDKMLTVTLHDLEADGYRFERHGGNHDIYFNPELQCAIPVKRHKFTENTLRYIRQEIKKNRRSRGE